MGETNPLALQALLDKAAARNEEMAEARERAAAQIADQVAVAKRALGHEDAPKREAGYSSGLRLAPMVKMVKVAFAVGDDLYTVERAIRATGIRNRGAALGYICNYFIRMHGETPDEQEA